MAFRSIRSLNLEGEDLYAGSTAEMQAKYGISHITVHRYRKKQREREAAKSKASAVSAASVVDGARAARRALILGLASANGDVGRAYVETALEALGVNVRELGV